jgi:hypothetical protein
MPFERMPFEGIPSNSKEWNQNHSLMHFHNGTISTTCSDEVESGKTEDDPNHSQTKFKSNINLKQSPILEAPDNRLAYLPLRNAHGTPHPPKQ